MQGAGEERKQNVRIGTLSAYQSLQHSNANPSTGRAFGSVKRPASEVRKP